MTLWYFTCVVIKKVLGIMLLLGVLYVSAIFLNIFYSIVNKAWRKIFK